MRDLRGNAPSPSTLNLKSNRDMPLMKIKNKRIIIRLTLWWGIIADLMETIRMVFPELFISTTGAQITINPDFRFALLYGSPVMLGWTILLFWADRDPIKRKGIFLCLIPVIIGYVLVEIIGIQLGVLNLKETIPTFIMQTVLFILTIISFVFAKQLEQENGQL